MTDNENRIIKKTNEDLADPDLPALLVDLTHLKENRALLKNMTTCEPNNQLGTSQT